MKKQPWCYVCGSRICRVPVISVDKYEAGPYKPECIKYPPKKKKAVHIAPPKTEDKIMPSNIVAEFGGEKEEKGKSMYQVLRVSMSGTNGWLFVSSHSTQADATKAAKDTAAAHANRRVIVAEIDLPDVKA